MTDPKLIAEKMTAPGREALLYIFERGGAVMPNTRMMAEKLSALGSIRGLPSDLVIEERGGPSDPHALGNGVFRMTTLGREVAQFLAKTNEEKT